MKKILFMLLALLPILGFAQSGQSDLMKVVPNDPAVRTGTLESGIKYYIRHNAKDPQRANFHIVYNVGAIQEEDNQNGLAHFLEHMAFNGSKNFPGNGLINYLQSIGVRFGENLNAGTGQELTTYMVTNVPVTREGIIDSVLLVLHDWAGFITLDHKEIDEERGVILEELRGGRDAMERVGEKFDVAIHNNSIYAKRNIIGTDESLKSFTYKDIESFYERWYRPDMQAFVIVGDIDVDAVEAKLKKVMADIKESAVKTPKTKVVVEDNEKPLVVVATDPELTSSFVRMYYRHKPVDKQMNDRVLKAKIDVISRMISQMINTRLSDISKKENAPFIGAGASYISPFVEPFDVFYFAATFKDGDALKAFEAVYTEVLRMKRGGFLTSEFERAKVQTLSQAESAFKNRNDRRNNQFIQTYMNNFLKNSPYPSAEESFEMTKQLVESTTLEQVNAVAMAIVTDGNKNTAITLGAPSSSPVPTETELLASLEKVEKSNIELFVDDVKNEPLVDESTIKVGKVVKTEKGKFESTVWTLSNGVKVILKPTDFKADEVVMRGTQKGGLSTISDIADLKAMQDLMYVLPNAGLGNFTQSELGKALTGKIANSTVGFGDLTVSANGACAPKDIETMLQLNYLRFTAPRFEQSDVNVVKTRLSSILPNFLKNPSFLYSIELVRTTTGNNPRAMTAFPTVESIEAMSAERISKVYKQLTNNVNGMTFVFTGNFDEATLKPLVEKYIASLPSLKTVPTYGKNKTENVKGEVTHNFNTKMETPKVTASVVYSGDIKWTLEERVNLEAIEHVLDIIYTKSIREEAGGTYGVGVNLSIEQHPRPEYALMIQFMTDVAKIDELLPIVYKEIDNIVENSISEENLKIYKEYAVKSFSERNITNGIWASYLNSWYLWGNDNYTDYIKTVEGLTRESIKQTAKKAFTQKNVVTVVQKPE